MSKEKYEKCQIGPCEKERMSKLFVLGMEISGTVQKKWDRNVFVVCKTFKIV